jgi:predicted O-methyltransferase YrrM
VKLFFFIFRYCRFLLNSGNAHSIHSPFVFDLYTKVVCPQKEYYCFRKIESIRKHLLTSATYLRVTDLGAGSLIHTSAVRKISSITRHSGKSAHIGQLLFKFVLYFKPLYIFDLGTSVGISTAYLAKANSHSRIYTFEGCTEIAAVATTNFKKLHLYNIRQVNGNIDETLEKNIDFIEQSDMVFFDANHRYESTLRYFHICLSKAHENSVFIFDDIHWSQEMENAWKAIKEHEEVTLTIDFFHFGMVFFRKAQPRQHFTLRL